MHVALDDADVERIAARVVELLRAEKIGGQKSEDRWMTSAEAAEHLGLSLHALRHLVARRAIPYVQDRPGARIFFRASQLDAWRAEQTIEARV
jgi:excisionase family DNA binding protein